MHHLEATPHSTIHILGVGEISETHIMRQPFWTFRDNVIKKKLIKLIRPNPQIGPLCME